MTDDHVTRRHRRRHRRSRRPWRVRAPRRPPARGQSLVAAVGQVVVDLQPPGAKDFVVALFGTNDKLALELLIVVVSLAFGAGLGILAGPSAVRARRAGLWRVRRASGFLAALGDPEASPGHRRRDRRDLDRGRPLGAWPARRTREVAARRGPTPDRPDARLVAAFVPAAGRRRSGWRPLVAGMAVAPSWSASGPRRGAASRSRPATGPRPVLDADDDLSSTDPGADADRHAERSLLPDRYRAAHPDRRHGDLDAAHPRPRRSRDDAHLGRAPRPADVRAVRDDRLRQQRGRRRPRRERQMDRRPAARGARPRRRPAVGHPARRPVRGRLDRRHADRLGDGPEPASR